MNIKSLLLGSAAALVAVTGARAADPAPVVYVEPDPVEYVRVCDVYGAGFYYIPGTETCLQISGYVRFKYAAVSDIENSEGDDYQAGSNVRVRLNFDAREETELGLLRAFARVQATNSTSQGGSGSDATYAMDMGYIQLGGLTMGYLDSLWTQEDGLPTDTDLAIGDFQTNRVSYTFANSGFSLGVSLEEDGTGDFAPDVVGLAKYEGGWGGVYIAASYDEEFNDFLFAEGGDFTLDPITRMPIIIGDPIFGLSADEFDEDDGAFAIKGGVTLTDLIASDSELKVEGSYAFDPSRYSTLAIFNTVNSVGDEDENGAIIGGFGDLPVEWSVGAGYGQAFGPLGIGISGIYGETFAVGFGGDELGDGEFYRIVGNVGYEITNNFTVLGEVAYANIEFDEEFNLGVLTEEDDDDGEFDQTTGFVQFIRSF